jgi:hypothetical protein
MRPLALTWRTAAAAWPPPASSMRTVRLTCIGAQISDLASAEGNDASLRIVGRDANGDPIARNDFDTEAAHPATELRQNLVTLVTLNAIEAAAVYRHDGTLHIDEIVLAQLFLNPFNQRLCHISNRPRKASSCSAARSAEREDRRLYTPRKFRVIVSLQ